MLTAISIAHFTIVDKLQVEFAAGMTALTGETGAGKSLLVDALGIALGARADSSFIRHGAEKADISAVFDTRKLAEANQWLQENDFDSEEECILRRVISRDGRSKAFINGQPVTLQTLKTFGNLLVDIHSQHAHHQLLQREYHQKLLDAYADCRPQLTRIGQLFRDWQSTAKKIQQLQNQANESDSRKEYLQFQLAEFHELNLQSGEYETLESRHNLMANAESLQDACQRTLDICRDREEGPVISELQHCQQLLSGLTAHSSDIQDAYELLNSASIQIQEACHSLRHQLNHADESGDLEEIETRLAEIHDLARKHRVLPQELAAVRQRMEGELHSLENSKEELARLKEVARKQHEEYQSLARQLTQIRETASDKLAQQIKQQLKALGMSHCEFVPILNTDTETPRLHGHESEEFLVSTNPGLPPQGLQKVASGGELSRISLAIQVITARASTIPTLVFDEVDVGIGGATAEVVGKLLRKLGTSAQVICITHQPQVAAQASHHYRVAKTQSGGTTQTAISPLDADGKVHEIARMLGGVEITKTTLDHAREMLDL